VASGVRQDGRTTLNRHLDLRQPLKSIHGNETKLQKAISKALPPRSNCIFTKPIKEKIERIH
jgi:hypothetical protein